MSGRGRSVRRRVGKAVAKQTEREGRGMRAAVDPAPAKDQIAQRWHSQKPQAKRKRADDNAANGEVVDFCDIFRTTDGLPRGHNVGKHEAQAMLMLHFDDEEEEEEVEEDYEDEDEDADDDDDDDG
ncbi:hypothetical protein DPMN_076880 [Dreissena polymorpha]|uniref:Uncharacterized protein n=1 Tax=Dreissena polymorpha TaxID=45954 RepID=A0A9D4BMT3_DREPO|nr:hypothetical protein DPMN_076880 [Dreissena polymorpha]